MFWKLFWPVAAIVTTLVLATPRSAMANDLDLIRGKITHADGYTTIVLGLKNNTQTTIASASVNCGFYRGDELVDDGDAAFVNLQPNQIGYGHTSGKGEDITRIDCRIDIVNP